MSSPDTDVRFERLYADSYERVHAYVRRRCRPDLVSDVVADVFLVAWRRLEDVPAEPLPWLYGVARRTIANARRGADRRDALVDRAGSACAWLPSPDPADEVAQAHLIREALALLPVAQREALMLVAWEGLGAADAARAAGCSRPAFAVRLHRAKRRLASLLDATEDSRIPNLEVAR